MGSWQRETSIEKQEMLGRAKLEVGLVGLPYASPHLQRGESLDPGATAMSGDLFPDPSGGMMSSQPKALPFT